MNRLCPNNYKLMSGEETTLQINESNTKHQSTFSGYYKGVHLKALKYRTKGYRFSKHFKLLKPFFLAFLKINPTLCIHF